MLTVAVNATGLFELYNPTTNVWTQPGTISPGTIPNMPVNLADFGAGTGNSRELSPDRPSCDLTARSSGSRAGRWVRMPSTASRAQRREPGRTRRRWISRSSTPGRVIRGPGRPRRAVAERQRAGDGEPRATCSVDRRGRPRLPPTCGVFNSPGHFSGLDFATNTLAQVADVAQRGELHRLPWTLPGAADGRGADDA